ncbi:integral membrane protein [Treponema primitia ZAS-2]|uniref:Integral membrane protein n=1 Tax=Treponema primitia (strain ATCC BAA-887 / DSM 12427 / ZAS-2) TaxID=545694 RepID=F5YMS6_TREPZ|nr:integral membrane protein [Treponema primitia ZAS-2]
MSLAMSVRTDSIEFFVESPIFLSAVTSWFLAQMVKAVVLLLKTKKRNGRELLETIIWRTGGMPSSHASMVSAMTTSIAIIEGVRSNLFAVSFFMSLIVMRDAMGVRRSSGMQAKSLNNLGHSMEDRLGIEYHAVKEVQGHAPLEVVVGALLGIFIAAAYAFL